MASTQSKIHNSPLDLDPFDSLLTLEDSLYTTAYTQGVNDGAKAGRIEGRIFGLEKGFEKFAALGELHGRSIVWGSRVLAKGKSQGEVEVEKDQGVENEDENDGGKLQGLPENTRLVNNVTLLHSLTDPETFSTDNTEEAVADFDDRVKRAGAKAKVIERIVGEGDTSLKSKSPEGSPATGRAPKTKLDGQGKAKKQDDSMEDFAGSRLLR